MNKEIEKETFLIAACGLYCGACSKYIKGNCPGCKENVKASWCKTRSCCLEKSIANCSECKEFIVPKECIKFNNIISRTIGFVTGTSRPLCIEMIKNDGPESFVSFMAENKFQSIPKKYKLKS